MMGYAVTFNVLGYILILIKLVWIVGLDYDEDGFYMAYFIDAFALIMFLLASYCAGFHCVNP